MGIDWEKVIKRKKENRRLQRNWHGIEHRGDAGDARMALAKAKFVKTIDWGFEFGTINGGLRNFFKGTQSSMIG
jgi:hypothetical protein